MTVRDPGFDPRQPPASRTRPGWLIPVLVATLVLGLGLGVAAAATGGLGAFGSAASSTSTPSPSAPVAAAATRSPSTAAASDSPAPTGSPAASPSGAPAAAPTTAKVAIVPVTNFRSGREVARGADVRAIARGGGTYSTLALVKSDADAILETFGINRADLGKRLVTLPSAKALRAWLPGHRAALGFLRADDVDASVRALAWGSDALFGVGRVASLADWPLTASLAVAADAGPAYDPARAWTLVAGGDILLDRGIALAIKARGVDFPFDGGTADITGTCKDCSPFGWDTPYTKRTGHKGAVRELLKGADVAIANFENPAPNAFRFHGKGTVFSANPAYIKGLRNAGIDWVSLANNHIGDAGRTGMLQTLANVDRYGIAHAGLGKNTATAHKAALLTVGEVTVGILGYDTIAPSYWSGSSNPGSARMTAGALKRDVAAARKAGADVVVVMPHWGVEYHATAIASVRALAHAAIDAGADVVVGNHPHWAGAMEVYHGKPIWYALGNLVFDQTWSIPTMEGLTVEMTFDGTGLVQAKMRPHLILDKAQPNFLDPLGDGKAVLSQVFRASKGLLPW